MAIVAHGIDATHRVNVVAFPGSVEITARCINHQLELARSRSHGLRGVGRRTDLSDEERAERDAENLVRSVRQSKKAIRYHIQRCCADHMVTLTYRENMTDKKRAQADLKYFVKLVRAKHPEFHYVAAYELQDRGALHVHMAVKGRQDVHFLRRCWHRVLGCTGATGADVLGNVDVQAQKRKYGTAGYKWKPTKLAGYLSKYIGKHFDKAEHHSARYVASRGCPKPETKRYWIAATDRGDFIMQALDLAMLHGMEDFVDVWQSSDGTVLKITGALVWPTSHNGLLRQAQPFDDFQY